MTDLGELVTDQPDLTARSRKGAWLQMRRLVSESLAAAVESQPFGSLHATLVGGDERLARAAEADCAVAVGYAATVADVPPRSSEHVAIVLLPQVAAAERVELLRAAHRSVRPAGVLVIVATVVVVPGEHRSLIPSMRQLVEELNDASGLAVHVDELRSVRWNEEPYVRGVILSATALSLGDVA